MPEQVRADLALLEVGKEDAVDPPRQQPALFLISVALVLLDFVRKIWRWPRRDG